jgi:hypothetical protein
VKLSVQTITLPVNLTGQGIGISTKQNNWANPN